MAKIYDHRAIEKRWQEEWEKQKLYETPDSLPGKENFYTLVEFPYPSGDLHVGHWYAFSVPDIFARMKRMQGFNSLYPIGFDAFGLPAENAAIKHNADPAEWTWKNIERMHGQLRSMGNMFDWEREVVACDPNYYRWTQWLFLKFFEKGLAYRGKAMVNWDPVDQTVLANEQVLPDGTAERSGAKVEKKELEQWFFKITAYADRLLKDLDDLNWPEPIKEAQRNWIGRKEGIVMRHEVVDTALTLETFSAYPAWLFADTFIVIAPEHPLVPKLVEGLDTKDEVLAFVKEISKQDAIERGAAKEKLGVFTGRYVKDPLRDYLMPVWVANFALMDFGTGVIRCSAHDERDVEFAKKYNIPLRKVVGRENDLFVNAHDNAGVLQDSGPFTGKEISPALIEEMVNWFVDQGHTERKVHYRLRDWLISRQRYWGAPIPIVYDPEGKAHPIPEEQLPWLLPTDVEYLPKGTSPLGSSKELKERVEKIFGKGWRPEIDTMDTFVDSSWYFLRYLDSKNGKEFSSFSKQKQWMPVNRYSGGAEHTTMHLLYSRFYYKVLSDLGLATAKEPYTIRMNRGIILAEDGRKMSKRWGNVVNPDEEVERVGADAVRMYLAFIGPYNEVGSFPWNTNSLIGVRRFLERVAGLAEIVKEGVSPSDQTLLNQSIKKVGEDIESMKLNTSVSQLMILSNHFIKQGSLLKEEYETFLKLLAPFAPHLTEELWEQLGHKTSIHLEPWPSYDSSKLTANTVTIAVQINGKTKGTISVAQSASETEAVSRAREDGKLAAFLSEKPKRIVYVPGRILNFIGD